MNGRHVFISDAGDIVAGFVPSERMQRAIESQVRTGQKEQAIADRSEEVLSKQIGVPRTRDNSAFDLRNDDVGIEVKTLVTQNKEFKDLKITMSKKALGRKLAESQAEGLKTFTVVVDRRLGGLTGAAKYYVREGLGSFHVNKMTPINLPDLKAMVR